MPGKTFFNDEEIASQKENQKVDREKFAKTPVKYFEDWKASNKESAEKRRDFILDRERLEKRLEEIGKAGRCGYEDHALDIITCYLYATPIMHKCPICGYESRIGVNSPIERTITSIREKVKAMNELGYDAILDERGWCDLCRDDFKEEYEQLLRGAEDVQHARHLRVERNLVFKFRIPGSENYHMAISNHESDYQCVLDFLEGKAEKKVSAEIIHKMLGIEIPQTIKDKILESDKETDRQKSK